MGFLSSTALPAQVSVEEVVVAWHRLRRQWRLHRTLYEYLGKVRAKLPDKHLWAEVISRGRGADAPVSHSDLERLMQAVLQDTKPDRLHCSSCLGLPSRILNMNHKGRGTTMERMGVSRWYPENPIPFNYGTYFKS